MQNPYFLLTNKNKKYGVTKKRNEKNVKTKVTSKKKTLGANNSNSYQKFVALYFSIIN